MRRIYSSDLLVRFRHNFAAPEASKARLPFMKKSSLLLFALAVPLMMTRANCADKTAPAQLAVPAESAILKTLKPTHPRLLIEDNSWTNIKAQRTEDARLDAFLKRQEIEARALLAVEPVPYKKIGRRLLGVSRTVLRRVLLLAMQYQLTGDKQFLARARAEMLNAASYKDWNPSHFLDTAEMTTALAIGYDWLYDDLDAATRTSIASAIREKGLQAGIKNNDWVKSTNNWNAVCNAGMVMGALALADDEPQLAAHYLAQARQSNPIGMKAYAPDGIYPEGPGYWSYGTTYQVMLISALQSALGTDWGLSQSPGFLASAAALLQTKGPTGAFFNYCDSNEFNRFDGTTFWFAKQLNRPELARLDADFIGDYLGSQVAPDSDKNRTLPLAALWWMDATKPANWPLNWRGDGDNPVATFRSNFADPNAMWLAIKGGRATNSHGHMDAGSFVFESDGVRWARDLGVQNYESLESKKISLWDFKQSGDRWKVFRLNNFSHNTLTINGQLHIAAGTAQITRFGDVVTVGAVVDLSPVFAEQATRVTRGFLFRAGQDVTIRDEVEGLKAGDKVRFALVTQATITISDDGATATLKQQNKTLTVKLTDADGGQWEIASAQGPRDYDEENKGFSMLVANFSAPDSGAVSWEVTLTPGSFKVPSANPLAEKPIANWPLAAVK